MTVTVVVLAVTNLVRWIDATLAHQCSAYAGRRAQLAFTGVFSTLNTGTGKCALICLSVTVVVYAVTDLSTWPDKALACAHALLLAASTLTKRICILVDESSGRAGWDASCRLQTVVNNSIAVFVRSIASLGLWTVATGAKIDCDTGTREWHRLRVAGLHAGTVGRRWNTAGNAQTNAIVSDSIAVIVTAVAGLAARNTPRTDTIVNNAVTIIVLAIAGFHNRTVQGRTAAILSLIHLGVAIVVLAVADFSRIVAKPRGR